MLEQRFIFYLQQILTKFIFSLYTNLKIFKSLNFCEKHVKRCRISEHGIARLSFKPYTFMRSLMKFCDILMSGAILNNMFQI